MISSPQPGELFAVLTVNSALNTPDWACRWYWATKEKSDWNTRRFHGKGE
jgi:hypothetical protein